MISNFLFFSYLVFMSCSIPLSIGLQHSYKKNKLAWADSVVFVATRRIQLVCANDSDMCMPVDQNFGAGTSFVIDKYDGNSMIMTAAHLCYDYSGDYPQSVMDGLATLRSKFDMSIIVGEEMTIVDNILVLDIKNDICIFTVPVDVGREMPISRSNPRYGDVVWSIGAPAGYFPESAKPITRGIFSGEARRAYEDGTTIEFFNFSMPTVGGMSGSPIINESGEVVGIVSAVNVDWHMVSYSPTLEQIKDAIETATLKLKSQSP